MSIAPAFRTDGKRRRTPRLGIPASTSAAPSRLADGDRSPNWHELVQVGEKGDPQKKAARLAARRHGEMPIENTDVPRAQRRASHARGWNPGQGVRRSPKAAHVVHTATGRDDTGAFIRYGTACGASNIAPADQPRTDVLRRRLIRAARAS